MARRKNSIGPDPLAVLLWIITLLWLGFCLYLSWQTGAETAGFSWRIVQFLLPILNKFGLSPDPQRFHMGLRLFAHFGVFFVTGVLFAGSLEVMFSGRAHRDVIVFLLAAAIGAFIAVAAEVGKLAVPGRHLTWSEAGLNVLGAACGAAVVCLLVWLCAFVRARRNKPIS